MLKLHIFLFIHTKLKQKKALQIVQHTFNLHLYFSKVAFAVSSVILAQFINTVLGSIIIVFYCYEYHLSKWNVKINKKC